ncbi:hypothetical protein P4O66_015748 [Electrophorus voltai]|uniref:SH2 domain-containing protein n=1 Tax=Electrophorus voltai TaxID=2609070 RepID=A0AAD8YZY6_9TELE|nr:hypothetical protein P4O66_015748 [Electrophorus voltai]
MSSVNVSSVYPSCTVCTPSERLCLPLKQMRRTPALSNMKLKSHHTQDSTAETLWQNLHYLGTSSFKSQLGYLTGTHKMEQKKLKTHRVQSCLMFCMRTRVRMEPKQPAVESQADSTESKLKELALRWFTETQAPLILQEGNFPAWFQGFISRKHAEDHLRDKELGCFLIRLSEKATGYILSYKGHDRCRHFVINQNKTGQFIVTGDTEMHETLTSLIEHYKTSPIEPFGEYLTVSCFESSTSELYDVVQFEPKEKPGVSVKAGKNIWNQHTDQPSQFQQPPILPPKRNIHAAPPVPKRGAPMKTQTNEENRNSEVMVLYAQLDQSRFRERVTPPLESRRSESSAPQVSHGGTTQDSEPQSVRPRQSPIPGPRTVYSELALSECRSKSLPLLDNRTRGDRSYRLSTPSPSPLQLSPNLQKGHSKGTSSQLMPTYSHSLDKLCENSFYQLAGKSGNPNHTMQAKSTAKRQDNDMYAEVPCEPMPRRLLMENTYEQIPEPWHTPSHKGLSGHGNTYEIVENFKPKQSESLLGIKGDKWKWLLPEQWKK